MAPLQLGQGLHPTTRLCWGLQWHIDTRPLKGHRQVIDADRLTPAQRHGPLDAVLELPHIAGPRVLHQQVGRRRGNAVHGLARAGRSMGEKGLGQ